jgi:secreted trypsin-like serine protease
MKTNIIESHLENHVNSDLEQNLFDQKWDTFNSSLLIEVFRGSEVFTSSSVLITRNVLLTAAHSVLGIDKGYVHIGHSYSQENMRVGFKKVIIHNDYDKNVSNYKNDIALIILDNNLPKSIKPVQISEANDLIDTSIERVGFGRRHGANKRTWTNPHLVEVQDLHLELLDSKSVVGDSGGPLLLGNNLLGIHSTKEGNSTYAVNVSSYVDWINENLPIKSL